jgi:hypothetical protein
MVREAEVFPPAGLRFAQTIAFRHHRYNANLGVTLILRDGLCVEVRCHEAIGTAEEFLCRLDILAVGLEERRVGVREGMPSNPFDT